MHKTSDLGHEPKTIQKPGPPSAVEAAGAAGGKPLPSLRPRMSEKQERLLHCAQTNVLRPDPDDVQHEETTSRKRTEAGAGAEEPMDTSKPGAPASPPLLVEDKDVLHLHAVICIERSHYVTFLRLDHTNPRSKWLFFDSMADRVGSSFISLVSLHQIIESSSVTKDFSIDYVFIVSRLKAVIRL